MDLQIVVYDRSKDERLDALFQEAKDIIEANRQYGPLVCAEVGRLPAGKACIHTCSCKTLSFNPVQSSAVAPRSVCTELSVDVQLVPVAVCAECMGV